METRYGLERVLQWTANPPLLMRTGFPSGVAVLVIFMSRPVVAPFVVALGYAPALVGPLMGSYGLCALLVASTFGTWKHKVPWTTTRWVCVGLALLALAQVMVGVHPTLLTLFLSQSLTGAAHTLIMINAETDLGRAGAGVDRAVGWYATLISIGQLTGPLLGGSLADRVSVIAVFLTGAAFSTVAVALLVRATFGPGLRVIRERDDAAAHRDQVAPGRSRSLHYKELLGAPYIRIAMVASFSGALINIVRHSFYPLLGVEFGLSATAIGFFLSLQGIVGLIVRPLLPTIVRRSADRPRWIAVCIGLGVVAFGVTPLSGSNELMAAVAILTGIAVGFLAPLGIAMVADGVSDAKGAEAAGWRVAANRVAQFVAPVALGGVLSVSNPAFTLYLAALLMAGAGVVVLRDMGGIVGRPRESHPNHGAP